MKSASAYYLFLLYAVAVCKPFLPLVNDFLSHTFWNAAHVERVHHTHGNDHVHYELREAAEQQSKDIAGGIVSEPVAIHLPAQHNYHFSCTASVVREAINGLYLVNGAFLETHTPPPKA